MRLLLTYIKDNIIMTTEDDILDQEDEEYLHWIDVEPERELDFNYEPVREYEPDFEDYIDWDE